MQESDTLNTVSSRAHKFSVYFSLHFIDSKRKGKKRRFILNYSEDTRNEACYKNLLYIFRGLVVHFFVS